jgi:site-specific recombinase XerD
MSLSVKNSINYPLNYPMNFSGKLTAKIIIKDDYIRSDGTCALFIQLFLNGVRKRIPLNISCKPEFFDKSKQRIKSSDAFANDYNLLIEKELAAINKIELNYRLGGVALSMDKFLEEYKNPTSRLDFCKFWELEMINQKDILKSGTYRQQMSMLNKLKSFKQVVYFYEIDENFIEKVKSHFKKELKNQENTISSFIKSFKKYLHIANKRGIITPILHEDIKRKSFTSERIFLMPAELKKIHRYYSAEFTNATHKSILARFLFSCFTGLRISDIQKLTCDNFTHDMLFFTSEKTNKIQKIKLNETAVSFIDPEVVFYGKFTGEYINRELKFIAKACDINRRITYHVSRHTFATNYLLTGGNVVNLQKLLGHSKITETMIYVGIVESMTNAEIMNMDEILRNN